MGREFLPMLSLAPVVPGGSSVLSFALANPLPYPLANVTLQFGVYAFNALPGTGSGPMPSASPGLASDGASAAQLTIPVGALGPRAAGWSTPITVDAPAAAPLGTYAIRDALSFSLNGSEFRLESIGFFSPSVWKNATVLPNGSPTVNLTRLGVSGVLPETALLVEDSGTVDWTLVALGSAAGALALAGAYVALRRRPPSSSSGRTPSPEKSHAETALGKSESNAGD
jgi:hypothetical protein